MDGGHRFSTPTPKWIHFHGVPLHAWNKGVFRLLGDFIGSTIEVDHCTSEKEISAYGRVKVLINRICKLPIDIPLSVEGRVIFIRVEVEGAVSPISGVSSQAASTPTPADEENPGAAEISRLSSLDLSLRSFGSRARRRVKLQTGHDSEIHLLSLIQTSHTSHES
ncbi:hypothetical protein AAC387_Pa10g0301 [Persea americana]